jgi:hypothetical protein
MPNVPIAVTVDFNGVTLQNGVWAPQPAWTVTPDNQQVQQGNNRIVWTLTASNVPAGYTAGFTADGIVFKSTNSESWNDPPALQTDGTVAANDNFNKKKDPVTFYYTVNVHFTVVPAGGTDQTFPYDPDIQNEGGGNRLVKAAG